MQSEKIRTKYVLGLDIGVASIGWALIKIDDQGDPISIIRAGVHTFEAGVEGDVESGRDEARGAARRNARLPRRMHERRQRRRRKLLRLLQRAGLIPLGDIRSSQAIHEYILELDAELRKKFLVNKDRVSAHVLPYRLRAEALDKKLEPNEMGRALYHLAQRRGFLSNRKSLKKDEDEGVVKTGITELEAAMNSAEARTLGEYFSKLDPESERIRRRWTARTMYVHEFNQIWENQCKFHRDIMTEELKKEIFRAIFFQRPLKSSRHLVGRCELVRGARRAALSDRIFQRFRILQKINDLEVTLPNQSSRRLTSAERKKLEAELHTNGDLTFTKIKGKSILEFPKGAVFNFEQRDEEKKLPGHRTDEKMRAVFGVRWNALTDTERDGIVLEVLSFQNPEALARRAVKAWGLDEQAARALGDTRLEQGYASHSRRALRQLLECMEDGTSYATARRELFPDSFETCEPVDFLPPVLKAVPSMRNPAVARALTELRKLVNEVIRVHGKPTIIRIELARDLKRSRKEREKKSREIGEQEKTRIRAKANILRETGLAEPRRSDIEKALLWEECGGMCPYTGKSIPFDSLFGSHPQFDVEHIIPFSRCLDNSFLNKTLCYHEENRDRKRNRTPQEAYGNDSKRIEEVLARVRRFQGKSSVSKLRRFEMQELPTDFVNRQLNDTRYASRLAGDYLGELYGGRVDREGKLRIQVSAGGITAHLRNEWLLNGILGLGKKNRDDHRHHAVDALAIALAGPATVQRLQGAAEHASAEGRRLFARVQEPWAGFMEEARTRISSINVSRRLTKKIAGDLHEETNYSKEHVVTDKSGKPKSLRHVRKRVEGMNDGQAEDIVDPIVRDKVIQWIRNGNGKPIGFPTIKTSDGREIPIKSARIRKAVGAVQIALGSRARYVKPGANHHSAIVAVVDQRGKETKWEDFPVTRLEAHERKSTRSPIIQKDWGPNRSLKFSLAANEYVLMKDKNGRDQLFRLLSISEGTYEFRLHTDARMASVARKSGSGARIRASANEMRKRGARKVRVTYLGDVIPSND